MAAPHRRTKKLLLDGEALRRTIARIAHEIVERNPDLERTALVGIHTRGVPVAQRIRRLIEEYTDREIALGTLDITFHRDDVHVRAGDAPLHPQPVVRATRLDFPLEDDLRPLRRRPLHGPNCSGGDRCPVRLRTPCARPARGARRPRPPRAPDPPDYVGKNLPTSHDERVQVQLVEVDEVDRVLLVPAPEGEEADGRHPDHCSARAPTTSRRRGGA